MDSLSNSTVAPTRRHKLSANPNGRWGALIQYRYFFWSLVRKEFKVRYTQSFLGLLWMIIEPLLLVLTLSTIFTLLDRKARDGTPFPVFFYAGLLPWNLFKAALTQGCYSFIKDKGLIGRINFPREISIFKNWVIYFIEYLLASLAFGVVLLWYRVPPNGAWVWLPLLLFLVMCFSIGLMLLTASINVYVRDVGILLKALGSVWFWFSPVIFDFPFNEMTKPLFYLNPLVGIIKGFRSVILHAEAPNLEYLISAVVASVLMLVLGYTVFRKTEKGFVDVF